MNALNYYKIIQNQIIQKQPLFFGKHAFFIDKTLGFGGQVYYVSCLGPKTITVQMTYIDLLCSILILYNTVIDIGQWLRLAVPLGEKPTGAPRSGFPPTLLMA